MNEEENKMAKLLKNIVDEFPLNTNIKIGSLLCGYSYGFKL